MADSKELKEVLAAIKKTAGLRDRIRKELGLDKDTTGVVVAEDIYQFEYQLPECGVKNWITLHGECIGDGQAPLLIHGYQFITINHFRKKDETVAGVKCKHCGELLDKATYESRKEIQNKTIKLKHEEYLIEKAIRDEWEEEQILLGNM
jgi:hypothetical protein